VPGILSALKTLWGTHGSEPFSGTSYSNLISPYMAFIKLPDGHHVTLAGGSHGTERTFGG
jgi:hypothetical protein